MVLEESGSTSSASFRRRVRHNHPDVGELLEHLKVYEERPLNHYNFSLSLSASESTKIELNIFISNVIAYKN